MTGADNLAMIKTKINIELPKGARWGVDDNNHLL
jgi:hypothetical protein